MTLPINISDCDLDVMTMHIFLITCLINENYKFQIGFCWLELEAIPNILAQLVECYNATQHTAPNYFQNAAIFIFKSNPGQVMKNN